MRIGISALGQLSEDTGGRTYIINFVHTCIEMKLPHEYFIFYSGSQEDVWGELPPNFHKITVPFSLGSSWAKGFGLQFVMPFCVIGKKLDVIYFTNNFASIFCFKPYIVAVRSTLYYHFPWEVPWFKRVYRKTMSWLSVRFARRILVPSESIARDVVRFMGAPPERITVVPHGVDTQRFAERAPEAEISARLSSMGLRRPYLLFVSALWRYKGADKFISALKLMRERTGRTDILGAIAGKGLGAKESTRQLEQLVEESGMREVVHFLGQRSPEDMPYLYWGAEALVFPSYYESFGNPLVEAMAAGTPIIASDRHAIPEIVGPAAVIVDPDQVESLAQVMERVSVDPVLRERLIVSGREEAKGYSWGKSVKSAHQMLESVAKPKILLFGYLPPPYFGPSVTYQALMKSEFPRRFDVAFINIATARNVADVEALRAGKLFRMAWIVLLEIYNLLTHRFDFCSCPISVNRNAFLRDATFLAIARAFRVPTIVYAHGNNLPDFYDRSSPLMKRVIKTTCSRAVGGIVMGNRLRPNLGRWLPQERIFPATDGVEVFSPMPEAPKQRLGISVLYLGNLIHEKGVFVVLESAARIRKQRRDIRFVFAGAWFKGTDEQLARELVLREGLTDSVEFVGRVVGEQKWQLLVAADMLVFPTFYYYETLGLVLLEAMQAGLPVVTTSRASIPDIIEEGVNGLFVAEQDPVDLVDKILRLADDPALRQRMGAANREKFHRLYTHEHYGRRMIQVFETLVRRGADYPGRSKDGQSGSASS